MLAFDNSILSSYHCPRRGYYADVLAIQPNVPAPELLHGIHVHAMLEHAFLARRTGTSFDEILESTEALHFDRWPPELVEFWKYDPAWTWMAILKYLTDILPTTRPENILFVEEQAQFVLSIPNGPEESLSALYVANLDLGILDGSFLVVDWKTSSRRPTPRFRDFYAFHPAYIGYVYLCKQSLGLTYPCHQYAIHGLHIEARKTKEAHIETSSPAYYVSDKDLAEWPIYTAQKIADILAIRSGQRKATCNHSCCFEYNRKCPYFELCEKGISASTLGNFKHARWNPIARQVEEID